MKKHFLVLSMALILVICLSVSSFAAIKVNSIEPSLSFSGTTANCGLKIYSSGNYIDATITLYYGSTVVDSWSKTGNSYIKISDSTAVISGRTYTLEVTGTIGGVAITCNPITKTCP